MSKTPASKRSGSKNVTVPAKKGTHEKAKGATPKKAAPPVDLLAPADGTAPVTDSSGLDPQEAEAAYQATLPLAQGLSETDVIPYRAHASLVYTNVATAIASLNPYAAKLARLPEPFELAAYDTVLPLAKALVFASAQIDPTSEGVIAAARHRGGVLREMLLTAAISLSHKNIIPAHAVKKIQAGTGPRDAAQDCIDLAALFRKYASAVKGKTVVTAADVAECAAVGNQLIQSLKPARARSQKSAALQESIDVRNRLWTLLSERYTEQVRRAGHWFFGEAYDAHTPALMARSANPKKRSTAPATPPTPTQPTTTTAKDPKADPKTT